MGAVIGGDRWRVKQLNAASWFAKVFGKLNESDAWLLEVADISRGCEIGLSSSQEIIYPISVLEDV